MKKILFLLLTACSLYACEKYSDTGNRTLKKQVPYFLQDRAADFAGRNFLYFDFLHDTIEFTTDYNTPPLVTEFNDTLTHFRTYIKPLAEKIKAEVFAGLKWDNYREYGNTEFIIVHNFTITTLAGDYVDYTLRFYYDAINDSFRWD